MPAPLAKSRPRGVPEDRGLYERDFYEWTRAQAEMLRRLRPSDLDWENVAEEIESLGRSDKRSIASNLNVVLLHLLKWRYQAEKRKAGWRSSVTEHRARLQQLLDESPSLKRYPSDILEREYELARLKAIDEAGLPEKRLPLSCPYSIEQVLDLDFWPEATEK